MTPPPTRLLVEERRRKILDLVNRQARVTVDELVKRFGVSAVTIRGDLDALSRAVSNGKDADPEFLFQAYAALIACLEQTGRLDEAREKAQRMVERFPEREEARRILARL